MYEEDYDGEPHDYGFDLPDTRYSFITKDEGMVSIQIVRHWQHGEEEDDRPQFKVSFNINYDNSLKNQHNVLNLPIGTTEDKAIDVAYLLYEVDEEYEAERRMGA
jgi:hypothetical protein